MMVRDWNLTQSPGEQTVLTCPYLLLPDDLRIPLKQVETCPRARSLSSLSHCYAHQQLLDKPLINALLSLSKNVPLDLEVACVSGEVARRLWLTIRARGEVLFSKH